MPWVEGDGGYGDLLKGKGRTRRKITRAEKVERARSRAVDKLGEEKAADVVAVFRRASDGGDKEQTDGVILTLLAQALSQIEVVALLHVGGYRVARLARYDPEEEELRKQRRVAWHAATEEDKQAIKDQIDRWDIEPGYPCQHRRPLEYLGCAGKEWQQYYNEYKEERLAGGKRVLSLVRWREYVRAFRPRLRLKRATTDNCNSCYKIEIELKDPTISQERKAELKLQKEMHLEKAIVQRRAMNKAIADYQIAWAPEECIVKEALSLVADDSVESEDLAAEAATLNQPRKIIVLCEDYGQAIALPSYKLSRPNVDYFNSDLHLQMFNISDVTQKKNTILLYDERTAGKDGNATCSLRWYYHCKLLKNLLDKGVCVPTMAIKVLDNCVGQNKSQCTLMFDCLLSLLIYDRVANFYLLPGHSHMKPDQVTSSCKRALKMKNLFIPDQVVDAFNSVNGMDAECITSEMEIFRDWDRFLKKNLKPLPTGFTENYCFEVANGAVVYKPLVSTPDEDGKEHVFCNNLVATRNAILAELLGLPPTAELTDIVSRHPRLPLLEERPVAKSKEKSIANKLSCIPAQYRAYYPGSDMSHDNENAAEPSDDAAAETPARMRKRPVGRPKRNHENTSGAVQKSILNFMLASQN